MRTYTYVLYENYKESMKTMNDQCELYRIYDNYKESMEL